MSNYATPAPVHQFWDFATACGRKPKAVFVVVHTTGSTHPRGYVQAWAVTRSAAEGLQKTCGGKTLVERLDPPGSTPNKRTIEGTNQ